MWSSPGWWRALRSRTSRHRHNIGGAHPYTWGSGDDRVTHLGVDRVVLRAAAPDTMLGTVAMRSAVTRWLLPYVTALLVGVIAGTIANSGIVAGLAALLFAGAWNWADGRSDDSV
jgi:hypothetical protein